MFSLPYPSLLVLVAMIGETAAYSCRSSKCNILHQDAIVIGVAMELKGCHGKDRRDVRPVQTRPVKKQVLPFPAPAHQNWQILWGRAKLI